MRRLAAERQAQCRGGRSQTLAFVAQARVQFRDPLLEQSDIFGVGRLQLPQILLVDVCHFAGLDGLEQFNQPVSLLVPVLRAHNDALPLAGNIRSKVY